MKPAALPAQHFSSGSQQTQATPERNLKLSQRGKESGTGLQRSSGSALQRAGVLDAGGCLPRFCWLHAVLNSSFLLTREPTCVLAEAHGPSYLLDLLLQKTQRSSRVLLLQPVTFQGSRLSASIDRSCSTRHRVVARC